MAVRVDEATKGAIRAAVDMHRTGPYVWGRRDCITLVEAVLGAQGIHVNFRAVGKATVLPTAEDTMIAAVRKWGTLQAMFAEHLDAVEGLERADSEFEWEAGMVGLTPQEGQFAIGMRMVDADDMGGSTAGVVDERVVPRIMTFDRGLQTVGKLWPRWKPRRRLARGE